MQKYRMYVDEVGNSDLGSSDNPNHRFISLTGVVWEEILLDIDKGPLRTPMAKTIHLRISELNVS